MGLFDNIANIGSNLAANVIGGVDTLTPGRLGQTLNTNLRDPGVSYNGATNGYGYTATAGEPGSSQGALIYPIEGGNTDPNQAPTDQGGVYDSYGNYYSSQAAAQAAAQQREIDFTRAQLDAKESALRSLLGQYDEEEKTGLKSISDNYNTKYKQGTADYDAQNVLNDRNRNQALENVDTKVRTDWSGLRRLLAGTGAANESANAAARQALIRQGGQDRQKQVQTFGDNEAAIYNARNKWKLGLDQEKANKEETFKKGLLTGRNDLNAKLADVGMQKGALNGSNYQQLRDIANGYQGTIDANNAKINALPAEYQSVYNTTVTPASLNQFNVDKTALDASRNGVQEEYSPYSSLLRKKVLEQQA